MESNNVSLKIASEVEKVLKFNGLTALIPIINSMSLCLKLPEQFKQLNSTLSISPKGQGKSTLLIHILAKSNPKYFVVLPKKMFESQLLEKPKDYFNHKIMIHDDIISALGGTNKKQREQLTGFFTQLLSDGNYSRENKELKDITCLAHFGIAHESFEKHHKDLIDNTFLDRFATYSVNLNFKEKMEILEHRDQMVENDVKLPIIKLPLTKNKVEVKLILNEESKKRINQLAMELDTYNLMSSNRAKNYITIFLLSNALLNNRKETNEYDLEMYEKLHKYHLNCIGNLSKKRQILALKQRFPDKNNEELITESGIPKSTFYRINKELQLNET